MNPKLIKRGLDDEEYANACTTIHTHLIAHYSTLEAHRGDLYGADCLFFNSYPARRIYLRPAFVGEFDIEEDSNRPTLWVQVMQLSPGFHQIIPVWRGSAFWSGPQADSDQGVGSLCHKFAMRQGMNLSQWIAFIQDQRVRKTTTPIGKRKDVVN